MTPEALTRALRDACGSRLVALTSGKDGCVLATKDECVIVPPYALESVVDATGAGDAFLGGLVAGT